MSNLAKLPHRIVLVALCLPMLSGCASHLLAKYPYVQVGHLGPEVAKSTASDVPRELQMVSHPVYRVAPPDILLIEAVNNIRPADDPLRTGDQLIIQVANTPPPDPAADPLLAEFYSINGPYLIESDGEVDLGPEYGSVRVVDMTLDQAQAAIDRHLRETLKDPKLAVSLPDVAGKQAVQGDHLVRPDGTVSLGVYGSVYVAGMTLDEIKAELERHLSQFINRPEVSVDVSAYNSKVYYLVTDGGGFGEEVVRLPCTGNETVLDALSNIQGLSDVSSKKIWIARPAPPGTEIAQTLQVDWRAIVADGITTTNYQILPGDRIYIEADKLIVFDNFISKVTAPFERIVGFMLLGNGAVRNLQQNNFGGGGGGGFGGGF